MSDEMVRKLVSLNPKRFELMNRSEAVIQHNYWVRQLADTKLFKNLEDWLATELKGGIFTADGIKLDPDALSSCEYCEDQFKVKDMYNAGRVCESCRDMEVSNA